MPKFSKRDYQAIADVLAGNLPGQAESQTIRYMRNVAREMADYFAAENPRFDRTKFLEACDFYRNEPDYFKR